MDRRTTRRLATAASGVIAVSAFLFVAAAPVFAQVPDPSGVIEDVTEGVDNAATQAGDGVADAVEDVTGGVGDAVGGEAGDATKDLGSTAADGVRDATGTTGDAIGDTGSDVDDLVEGVLGGSQAPGRRMNDGGRGSGNDNGRTTRTALGSKDRSAASAGDVLGAQLDPVGPAPAVGLLTGGETLGFRDPGTGGTIIDALGGITFPLALIAIVAAFLAIQGRLDSADPKLSIAILDPEDEKLSFQ